MIILSIDPAQKCGWALFKDGRRIGSGVWKLKPGKYEGSGMAFLRLRTYLGELFRDYKIDAVVYEDVAFNRGGAATFWYSGIVATVQTMCADHGAPYSGIAVATVKRRATGNGGAGKPAMLAAARAEWGMFVTDDNEADALWIGIVLHEELTP